MIRDAEYERVRRRRVLPRREVTSERGREASLRAYWTLRDAGLMSELSARILDELAEGLAA